MVYSLQTDSWKIHRYHGRYPEDRYHSVLVNNQLHWKWNVRKIPSFDLHDEQCTEVSLPPYDSRDLESRSLEVLDDCLCATISISPFCDDGEGYSDIWIMKEYGIEESWAKVYTFPYYEVIPLGRWNGGCEVLFSNYRDRVLFLWNSQLKTTREIDDLPMS